VWPSSTRRERERERERERIPGYVHVCHTGTGTDRYVLEEKDPQLLVSIERNGNENFGEQEY
jgi:hypothetical protein